MLIVLFFASILIDNCVGEMQLEAKSATSPSELGEGPFWDEERQILFYVDILNQTLNRYDPKANEFRRIHIEGGSVSLVIPVKFEDEYLITRGLDLGVIQWDGKSSKPGSFKILASVDREKPENRFNDGKVDNSGRLWAGTMGPEKPHLVAHQGSLFSFEPSDCFKSAEHLTQVSVSNGMAWNRNDTLMYYADSPTRKIDIFDFDIINGTIDNRRTLFCFDDHNVSGVPDGMTIDENDNLWVAVYDGNAILNIDTKNGALLRKIYLPAKKVTSCTFGGPQMDILYVTTARKGLSEKELEEQPDAGRLFQVTGLGVKGQGKQNKVRRFSQADGQNC